MILKSEIASYQYCVRPGNALNVTVWGHPELATPVGQYRSSSDTSNWMQSGGTTFYLCIDKIHIVGRTLVGVRSNITGHLTTYITDPQVDVNIAASRSQKVYVPGWVNKSGQQTITNIPPITLDTVNVAGGLADIANQRSMVLTHNGREERIFLQALIQSGDPGRNRLLYPDDIFYALRSGNLKVFVMGEVEEQSTLKMGSSNMALIEALGNARGIDMVTSNASGILIIRLLKGENGCSGKIVNIYQLDMPGATPLVMVTGFRLQPYGMVCVITAPVSRWDRLISQLLSVISGVCCITGTANGIYNQ